jgi:hypothetical protein
MTRLLILPQSTDVQAWNPVRHVAVDTTLLPRIRLATDGRALSQQSAVPADMTQPRIHPNIEGQVWSRPNQRLVATIPPPISAQNIDVRVWNPLNVQVGTIQRITLRSTDDLVPNLNREAVDTILLLITLQNIGGQASNQTKPPEPQRTTIQRIVTLTVQSTVRTAPTGAHLFILVVKKQTRTNRAAVAAVWNLNRDPHALLTVHIPRSTHGTRALNVLLLAYRDIPLNRMMIPTSRRTDVPVLSQKVGIPDYPIPWDRASVTTARSVPLHD